MNHINSISYLSAALPYVNAAPHLGHAFELCLADALARYRRQSGRDLVFVTGSDDNSLKNVRAAEVAERPIQELVAENAERFVELGRALGVELDDFVATSRDPRHAPAVHELWRRCAASGDLYQKPYRGLYCVGCEQFYASDELLDGVCAEHGVPPEAVEERNWFFRLSRHQDRLRELIASDRVRIRPEERKREVLAFIDSGLEDFSVSRTRERARGWGIEVPDDPEQVIFVWFDALTGYLSALGFPSGSGAFDSFWSNSFERTHLIGKGILRFHAVYWIAILLSAGIELPSEILVHGYLTVDGRKIGKSLGNAVDPSTLVSELGAEAVRWFLLKHVHSTKDADFSRERLLAAHDTELADQLGNLVRRSLTLVERHAAGLTPSPGVLGDFEHQLRERADQASAAVRRGFEEFAIHEAAASALGFASAVNRYLDDTAPWKLARDTNAKARLDTVLYHLVEALRICSVQFAPLLPDAAERIARAVGAGSPDGTVRFGVTPPGRRVRTGDPLFPRKRLARPARFDPGRALG